jgi:arylsulfatase A-like enzyme
MSVRRLVLLFSATTCLARTPAAGQDSAPPRPNVLFILIDDLGYADLSCTGNTDVATNHIDRLAREGTRFTQFYVAAPICSASRVAFLTGQYPGRQRINSYLASRDHNRRAGQPDWLDPAAPSVARLLQQAGYATGHFGKWHLGGGRDVGDAPLPQAYGFDVSLTSFEGLGDRILPPGRLSDESAQLGRGNVHRVAKHEMTGLFVDRAIEFIRGRRDRTFYVQLWLDDVHDPHVPAAGDLERFERFSSNPYVQKLYAVLDRTDRELGRLLDVLDADGLAASTLVLLTGDNGPTAWPRYYDEGLDPPGSTGGLRGRKWSLYEGGIRQPLLVRWPGRVPAGVVNETTVLSAVDFLPTLCGLAGIPRPAGDGDGEDLSAVLLGQSRERSQTLFWEYGRDASYLRPGLERDRSPNLAIREGRWKLLMNVDGTDVELYDLRQDPYEQQDRIGDHPETAAELSVRLRAWRATLR